MQNAAEIQQRVINLVELYRTKVGKESEIAKMAENAYDYEEQESIDSLDADGGGFGFGADTPEEWIKHLKVNEQLLGHFYSVVAGENAEKDILDQLLPGVYDKTVFTEEEELFLTTHFREMVNYIILTPCDDSLEWVHRHDSKDAFTISNEVLELIKARVEIPAGSRIYYPNTIFAQLANLFDDCSYYCDTMFYAWTKVAVFANNIDAENNAQPTSYDAIVSYLPITFNDSDTIARLCEAYKNLPIGGKFVLICPPSVLADKKNTSAMDKREEEKASADVYAQFRRMLVEDKAIKEIIQLPQVMSNNASFETYCLLIAEKGGNGGKTCLIDAQCCFQMIENSRHYLCSFDIAKLNAILQNEGVDSSTGLRKVSNVFSGNLSSEILIPQVYVIERPTEAEHPVPLSSVCSLASAKIRDLQFDLPEDTPWVTLSDLTPLYTGDLDISGIRKANCPNNATYTKGSDAFNRDNDIVFADEFWGLPEKAHRVWEYRRCTFLNGNIDAVLYEYSKEHGVRIAVVRATGKPYAVASGILVFCPKDDFDAKSLAALLRLPIVYRQLMAYEHYGIGLHLDDILVPTDKRIVGDELYRMKREKSVTKELGDKVQAMKTEYINEVRMRKHDMGQKVFDLINTEDLMRYYVENRETESDLWPQMEEQLDHFRKTINELSDMLDQLSQEEHFGTPELIDLNKYFAGLQHSNNINGFKLSYQLDRDSILDQQLSRMKDKDVVDTSSIKVIPTVFIAKNDLQRVISNILTNAQKHGFVDSKRKDYEVIIRLEFNAEKGMYQIDFRNNGQSLPEGLNKMRYGIRGEKAGQTAGTGLGGSVVKSIVEHYKGDYDVFMDGDWTVIRVYLPITI